ncbi:MAG: hypothetical protein CO099_10185 [Bdellovibrio sp. CG_4_9_14_3_um_filter_39_7]|nr:MAG: hypothetical protein CO099_10185 [Bdellovibrio sp. CG_4_9_14_3_um_filter_39_7]
MNFFYFYFYFFLFYFRHISLGSCRLSRSNVCCRHNMAKHIQVIIISPVYTNIGKTMNHWI